MAHHAPIVAKAPKNGNGAAKKGRPVKGLTPKDFGKNKSLQKPPRNRTELGNRLALAGDALLLGRISADTFAEYAKGAKVILQTWGKGGGVQDLTSGDMEGMSTEELEALEGSDTQSPKDSVTEETVDAVQG